MSALLQDLRFAFRQFHRRRAFTLATVVVLGLGLGANTAIFSVVNALLLRPLPYRDTTRILALYERNVGGGNEIYNETAPGTFGDWQKFSTTFDEIGAYVTGPITVGVWQRGGIPQRVDATAASRQMFTILGVTPVAGRFFTPAEDRYGAARVAIIGYSLWQQRFGGTADIVGQRIHLDGADCEVVGVMPPGFAFPERTTQVWQPLGTYLSPQRMQRHDTHFLHVIGQLKPGVSFNQGRAEIDAISARYHQAHPDDAVAPGANSLPLQSALVRESRPTLLLLWAAVGCVLLIACVNVANLLLARASGRAREIAIRAATGASRSRLVRLFLIESILLAVCGAALGLLLAVSIADVVAQRAPGAAAILPAAVPFDVSVFLFAFAAALVVGVASGLFPALQFSRADVAQGLRDGGRSSTDSRAQGRFRAALAAVEVAVSLVLLIAAGLLLRSFSRLMQVNPGVRLDHTITIMIPFIERPDARVFALFQDLPQRLRSIPGVVGAGFTSCLPATGHCNDNFFYIDGRPSLPGHIMDALQRNADPGYFSAIGLPLLRGRTFSLEDGIGPDRKHPRRPAIVVSESLAKTYFPGENPIGRRLTTEAELQQEKLQGLPAPHYEIIGVVGDTPDAIDRKSGPTFYMPIADQTNYDQIYAVLHTTGDPRSEVAAARAEINRVDPDLAIDQIRTIRDLLGESASSHQSNTLLFGSFAALALFLAAFGLYSVLSYAVSQRRAEIGVRMALGASSSSVAALILREGMKPAIAGMLIGLPVAAATCRVLKALLFGITPFDPVTFALAPFILLAVAAMACYLPALRAARIDPAVSLRND
ncbi:MAG TPA: ABC transporter permease [Bryobacteraceae bacterium]|nr:ABC transporter permease [Bryobacteraceae bacterium]